MGVRKRKYKVRNVSYLHKSVFEAVGDRFPTVNELQKGILREGSVGGAEKSTIWSCGMESGGTHSVLVPEGRGSRRKRGVFYRCLRLEQSGQYKRSSTCQADCIPLHAFHHLDVPFLGCQTGRSYDAKTLLFLSLTVIPCLHTSADITAFDPVMTTVSMIWHVDVRQHAI